MVRPRAAELTQREIEVMHVFWDSNNLTLTAAEVRDALEASGRELAYTTVATLVRILIDKGFLQQTGKQRPFGYQAIRTFKDVSQRIVVDLVERVFQGSREQLLLRLVEAKKLTAKERQVLEDILREKKR